MTRDRSAILPGGTYFLTIATRAPVFTTHGHVVLLREAIRAAMTARPFRIDAMVVLPDHLHCIWQLPPGDRDYAGRWREIKRHLSLHIDAHTEPRNVRTIWQRRIFHAIDADSDWRRYMDYIHYNPVDHGYVTRAADWPWSSFGSAVAKGWYPSDWGRRAPAAIIGMDLE